MINWKTWTERGLDSDDKGPLILGDCIGDLSMALLQSRKRPPSFYPVVQARCGEKIKTLTKENSSGNNHKKKKLDIP